MNITISTEVAIDYLGKQSEKERKEIPEKKEVTKDWNNLLKEEVQHNKFIIKRISKNIYNKLNQLKDIKDSKDSKDKEDIKEPTKLLQEENIDSQNANKDRDKEPEQEQVILRNKQLLQSEQPLIKDRDWANTLKEEVQQGKFIIKGISKNLPSVTDISEQPEKISTLRSKRELPISDNRIVKKIRFNIEANKYNTQQKTQPKFLSNENIDNQNNWKDNLKEDVQQNKFVIKKVKTKANKENDKFNEEKEKEFQRLKEIERQNEINKSKIEIEKNIEINVNVEPKDTLPLAKNKIVDNWKESISKEKSEELNIEKLPAKREIKIVTKRTLKKVENYYRKFNNLNTAQEQINIEGKQRTTDSELSSENSQITLNINKSYEPKKEYKLYSEKNNELFIHPKKKKEIKISTKKVYSSHKHIHSRFNDISISDEGQINIKGNENKTFGNDKLEKIENEKITINKIYDGKKNEELREKLQKETEELQDKLKKDNEELQNKLKENEDLQNKLKDKLEKEKENEELKNKLEKDAEDLKKENEDLKDKLEKGKENEELRKHFNNLNITQDQININKSYEPKKEYELTKNNKN